MSLRDYNIVLQAGVEQQIRVEGDFYSIYAGSVANPVLISLDSGAWVSRVIGDEQKISGGYKDIRVMCAVLNTITLVVGFGDLRSNVTSVAVTTTATVASPDQILSPAHVVLAGASAGLLAAAHANNQRVIIKNPFGNTDPIYLGPATIGAGQGASIAPGEGFEVDCKAAVYAYNPKATAQTIEVTILRIL